MMTPSDKSSPETQPAVWEFAGLMLTYWCSARCAFCYVSGGPERGGDLDVPAALKLWKGLDELAASHSKTMRIHLAGGEPFRDWIRLVSILRAARDAGLTPCEKVETNASWATREGLVRARLELLAALGVGKLVVSSDVFHQEFVPFDRVRRCVEIARQVFGQGGVIVRWWDFFHRPVDTRELTSEQKQVAFQRALRRRPERLSGRAAINVAPLLRGVPAATFQGQRCVEEVLQSRHVHIDPYGNIFPGTCGGIILGRVTTERDGRSVVDAWREFSSGWMTHPVLAAVVAGGSYELLQRVLPLGYAERPEGYATKCHLCAHIRQFLADRALWPEYVGPPGCYGRPEGAAQCDFGQCAEAAR